MGYKRSVLAFLLIGLLSFNAFSNSDEKKFENQNQDYIQYIQQKRLEQQKREEARKNHIHFFYKEQEKRRKDQREYVEAYYRQKSRMPASDSLNAEAEIEKEKEARQRAREKARQEYLAKLYQEKAAKEKIDRAYSSHPDIKARETEPWNH